jgi:thiamine transport system substrate-binding protein
MMNRTRSRLMIFIFGGAAVLIGALFGRSLLKLKGTHYEQVTGKRMRILAYSSFMGSTGPGPKLVEDFKKICNCEIEVSNAGDAGLLLERLRISNRDQYDLVIGLDPFSLSDAQKRFKWRERETQGVDWADEIRSHVSPQFSPYDWSPMTFIYRHGEIEVPKSLEDLTGEDYRGKIAIQDPQSSTPGLEFLQWIVAVKKDRAADYLTRLKPNVQSISPSWSFSYGLFKKGLAKLVFSYVTSLVYHWDVEKNQQYQAASFSDGHPYQVEFAAIPDACTECELAQRFLARMLSGEGQEWIASKNFMFPAVKGVKLSKTFGHLPKLKLVETPVEKDLEIWSRVFRK